MKNAMKFLLIAALAVLVSATTVRAMPVSLLSYHEILNADSIMPVVVDNDALTIEGNNDGDLTLSGKADGIYREDPFRLQIDGVQPNSAYLELA